VQLLTCQHCGTEFKSSKNKQQKFCGRDCYSRSRYGGGLP
jgi:protein-arginine kinase activator protein McsA